jgi:hypothetical protein
LREARQHHHEQGKQHQHGRQRRAQTDDRLPLRGGRSEASCLQRGSGGTSRR